MDKTVIELFAGVGGFRVGLNKVKMDKAGNVTEDSNFKFVWANQWEPATTSQDAFNCYIKRFGENPCHSNLDITKVDKKEIPDHNLLVGGFPCQDYSVARSLSNEKGIEGKKGVLWWQIRDILKIKKPSFFLLENVDRLLISPSKQRGRDFAIMLRCLDDLGYGCEWRVINAADYGFPQRRRRVYIFGFHRNTKHYKNIVKSNKLDILTKEGLFAKKFQIENYISNNPIDISKRSYPSLIEITNDFSYKFLNSGVMFKHEVLTVKVTPKIKTTHCLNKIIMDEAVDEKFFLKEKDIEKFKYLKGSKRIPRTSKLGVKYVYSEGSMAFPDSLDKPSRTMLTSESSVNRSTHIVEDKQTKKLRTLTPVEAERLNMFPDNWTNTGMTDKKRFFMMGNALVCGIIKTLGDEISNIMDEE